MKIIDKLKIEKEEIYNLWDKTFCQLSESFFSFYIFGFSHPYKLGNF